MRPVLICKTYKNKKLLQTEHETNMDNKYEECFSHEHNSKYW